MDRQRIDDPRDERGPVCIWSILNDSDESSRRDQSVLHTC